MKTAEVKRFPNPRTLAHDERKCLFDPAVRSLMENLGQRRDVPAIEALSALRWAGKGLHLLSERWAERYGLTEGRLAIMFRLRHQADGGVALGELASMLNVSARNVTGLIDNLERDGLVERVPDAEDRRSIQARLTPAGRERIDGIWRESLAHQVHLTEGFSEEELTQLRHLCLRLVQNMHDRVEGGTE